MIVAALALTGPLTGTASVAQGTSVAFGTLQQDPNAPVELAADQLAVDQASGTAVFTGNVLIGQGEMRLSAARVKVIYAENQNGIERLEATGGVTLVSGQDAAEAARADYNIESGVIVMTGDVLLTQGTNALTAERMTVNLESGTAQMSGRVKSILQPGGD
ncbi:lipopolysaccharide transport periplasmic protein LptA [Aliishimia ponticola]|uniref:lipopolysaccharide transport periplasmic protein LptA n=1 Tax=Aliishimia ponticola TaxID=2499833 RepID=UPI001FE4DF72|nr:lipopolysaccharide transport periplasmic protein LptA [Aliishimia ponticola]